jgi:hypothetical protein
MKRKQVFILIGGLVLSMGLLLALYAFSPLSKEIYRASFNRKFIPNPLTQKAVMDIEVNSFYIAGQTEDKIYLGNSTAPFHLLITNRVLTDSQHIMLTVKMDSIMDPNRFRLTVDPPYFFLSHGVMPRQLRGKVGDWIAEDLLGVNTAYFVESLPVGASSFVLRSYSTSNKGYELAKVTSTKPFQFNYDLLQKQVDGLFCLDGQLLYNKKLAQLVYLHYYRNEFVVADSNLNLVYRGHTIDTFSRARIKVAKIGDGNESMLAAPPMQINGISCVSEKYLLVQSNLLANNEDLESFENGSIVDVYDLASGIYSGSFYIPRYKNERLLDFELLDNQMVVISDHYLVTYELNLNDQIKL